MNSVLEHIQFFFSQIAMLEFFIFMTILLIQKFFSYICQNSNAEIILFLCISLVEFSYIYLSFSNYRHDPLVEPFCGQAILDAGVNII